MEFLITETQLKTILNEEHGTRLTDSIKILNEYTVNLVKQLKTFYNLNFKMLLTWGASVGGLMMPLDNFIKFGNFNLNDRTQHLFLFKKFIILIIFPFVFIIDASKISFFFD